VERDEDLTRDEMLVRLVSKLVFLLRERSSRVLASGAICCCEARLRLTVEMVRLVAVFRDSLDRDPTCCDVPFGIGYGCYLKEYIVTTRNVQRGRLASFSHLPRSANFISDYRGF
jgi:hypothetical protein